MRIMSIVVFATALAVAGCATFQREARTADDSVSASPGPGLVGTWRGTAFAFPGSAYYISTPVELQIAPDGTWTWRSGGETKGRGTVSVSGNRVTFESGAAEAMELQHRGDHVWGLSRNFIPGVPSTVDLRREAS